MSKYKSQITKLYVSTGMESLSLGGASWVALLSARGYSLTEIGVLEAIFHLVSLCAEIPSGAVADVLGRKKTMVASRAIAVLSAMVMIWTNSFWSIAVAMMFSALSYNLASGTREALAFDSLKEMGREKDYNRYASNELMIYRIGTGISTLFAGAALWLGYQKTYGVDVVLGIMGIIVALLVSDIAVKQGTKTEGILVQIVNCIKESIRFLKQTPKAVFLIGINSLVGATATLLLFFLQAKLPEFGLSKALLGPALFFMTCGAALGAKVVQYVPKLRFRGIVALSCMGIASALLSLFTGNPLWIAAGGFAAAFSDDFMEVRADVLLNEMVPSEQRATLVSVCSFAFSMVMIFLSPLMGAMLQAVTKLNL